MISRLHGLEGQSLLEVIRGSNHSLRAPCAGRGTCRKCRVVVRSPSDESPLAPAGAGEIEQLSPHDQARGVRLACLAVFRRTGDVAVEIGDDAISVPEEQYTIRVDPEIKHAAALSGRPMRVAVDVGTTTLAVCLIDVTTETVLSVKSEANAQKSWGADVMARIQSVCEDPGTLNALQTAIVRQLDRLIRTLLAEQGRDADELDGVAVAGNTSMLHLLVGESPSGMARLPFRPAFLGARSSALRDYGFRLPEHCQLSLLPGVSAFVGADIVAGILATELHRSDGLELLLDIGTNGEMVLGNAHGMLAAATAAGPAFEGAQITHGCAGVAGALDHAGEGADGFWYTTINDAPLRGICGSGLLDLVAWLRRRDWVDETGSLDLPDRQAAFHPDPARAISLNQRDIRQVQLAKGAIAAGIELLCRRAGITVSEITRVYLAGGFGAFLRPEAALAIGLLPKGLTGKISPVGNTSLKGALLAATRASAVPLGERIAQTVEVVDLAAESAFQEAFAECMLFPETSVANAPC